MSEAMGALQGGGGNGGGAPTPAPSPAPSPTPNPAPTPSPTPTPAPIDRWQDKFLPDDLRGDETLGRYQSIPDMAKGLLETRAWAKGRVAIPQAGDDAGFAEFVGKVRPPEAKDYAINGPDGKPSETGEAFRQTFHDIGLHPIQAEKLTQAWNQYAADTESKMRQAGKDDLTAIELDMGSAAYNQRLAAAGNMLSTLGIDVADLVPALEQVAGAGATMKALFKLAESTGELAKVDGDTVALHMGAMSPDAAERALDDMATNKDAEFQKRLGDPNTPEYKKRQALLGVIARSRAGGG